MGFLDDLGKKVTDAGQKTLQKTKEISDVARINAMITEEEKHIDSIYHQIGKLYISVYGKDCGEEFEGMVNAVAQSEEKIKDYKKQIRDIKGVQCCEKCGAEVEKGFAFCSACGAPMPIVSTDEDISDSIKCNNCGTFVKKGMRFCTSCGKPIGYSTENNAEMQILSNETTKRICPSCGCELEDDSAFCSECGTRL